VNAVATTKVVWASDRVRRWYATAAFASLGLAAVVVHAVRFAAWYTGHPVASPSDDAPSPGDGMGALLALMMCVVAMPIALLPPAVWLVARHRAGHGGAFLAMVRWALAFLLLGALLLLPLTSALPHPWVDRTALAVACLVGLAAANVPQRRVAAWAAAAEGAAAAQNQA
jgi:hypothetical protein